MQAWPSRRSECIFCIFRSCYKSFSKTPKGSSNFLFVKSRSFHQSQQPNSNQDQRVSKPDRHRRESGSSEHRNRESKPVKPSDVNAAPSFVLSARLQQAVGSLKKSLEPSDEDEQSKKKQISEWDPNGAHWSRFEESLKNLLDPSAEEEISKERQELYRQVGKALKSTNWLEATGRTLHFAFLDQILAGHNESALHATKKVVDLRYPTEWYTRARATQREIHLHVGPTNSGKTYNALKRLEETGNGFYAGPLRLLAHEVYSRFHAKGIACDLVTGDDVRLDSSGDVKLTSSTVEMVDVSKAVEVAVIDEIQMINDQDRGWAWTRAFLGANANEVHICGETRVVPLIRELAASMGDTLHIHQYNRLNPLKAMSRSLRGNYKNLRKGDCIVSFSIIGIHALKKQIELETGSHVAVVYGSLPPETRAQQAALFNDPDNDYDYLVASDAIGMGLNLSIKRIIFENVHKFNGIQRQHLSIPQIKQISGRAGRYRSANQKVVGNKTNASLEEDVRAKSTPTTVGLVTCMDDADLPAIQEALRTEAPPIKTAGLLPPVNFVEDYAARLPHNVPYEYIMQRLCTIAAMHPRFKLCSIDSQLAIGKAIEQVKGLTIVQRCIFAASPAHLRDLENAKALVGFAKCVAAQKSVTIVDIPEIPLEVLEQPLSGDRLYLESLERLHKALILYLWLSYRFLSTFKDRDMATHAKLLCEEKINTCLLEFSANPSLRKRLLVRKYTPKDSQNSPDTDKNNKSRNGKPSFKSPESTAMPLDWLRSLSNSALSESETSNTQNVHTDIPR